MRLSDAQATHQDYKTYKVKIEVADSGIGLTPEQISRLFRDFSQADSSTTRKFGGTGLGLAISKSLVECMKGQVFVESLEGIGSKFSFEIPLQANASVVPPPGASASKADWTPAITPPARTTSRILVAEDNGVNQKVIRMMLNKLGYTCEIVSNGREALIQASQIHYSIVFMDCQMPELDGFEATRQLRASAGPNQKTPVIALTANATDEDRKACLDAGMTDFMSKPIRREILVEILAQYLDQGSSLRPGHPLVKEGQERQ
jgi:two-component system, sensor histidine kinase